MASFNYIHYADNSENLLTKIVTPVKRYEEVYDKESVLLDGSRYITAIGSGRTTLSFQLVLDSTSKEYMYEYNNSKSPFTIRCSEGNFKGLIRGGLEFEPIGINHFITDVTFIVTEEII